MTKALFERVRKLIWLRVGDLRKLRDSMQTTVVSYSDAKFACEPGWLEEIQYVKIRKSKIANRPVSETHIAETPES